MFKSVALLGSFGEFCYIKFVQSKGLSINKISILECDFIVSDSYCIDVKTTQTGKIKYYGKRVRDDISYDVVSIKDGIIKVFPDVKSPLIEYSGEVIGSVADLLSEWQVDKKNTKVKSDFVNIHKVNRLAIKEKIKDFFPSPIKEKIKFVFRGSVSKTRWSSSPDNLPGSRANYSKYYFTIFIQMITESHDEKISRIFFFNNSKFPQIAMKTPDKRQVNKGIEEVIDFESYEKNYGHLIFSNLLDFKSFVTSAYDLKSL